MTRYELAPACSLLWRSPPTEQASKILSSRHAIAVMRLFEGTQGRLLRASFSVVQARGAGKRGRCRARRRLLPMATVGCVKIPDELAMMPIVVISNYSFGREWHGAVPAPAAEIAANIDRAASDGHARTQGLVRATWIVVWRFRRITRSQCRPSVDHLCRDGCDGSPGHTTNLANLANYQPLHFRGDIGISVARPGRQSPGRVWLWLGRDVPSSTLDPGHHSSGGDISKSPREVPLCRHGRLVKMKLNKLIFTAGSRTNCPVPSLHKTAVR